MAPDISSDGQLGMDERVVEDAELAAALEKRLKLSDNLGEVKKSFKAAHEACIELLREHDLEDGQAIRVGRFRITKKFIAGGPVSYEASDRSQLGFEFVG
jgi:hypothetical protein